LKALLAIYIQQGIFCDNGVKAMTILPNLSNLDRSIRVGVGLACIYLGFSNGGLIPNHMVALIIGAFGVVNLVAAAMSRCPVYAVCGISTLKKPSISHL